MIIIIALTTRNAIGNDMPSITASFFPGLDAKNVNMKYLYHNCRDARMCVHEHRHEHTHKSLSVYH